jgi:hypothetical protein
MSMNVKHLAATAVAAFLLMSGGSLAMATSAQAAAPSCLNGTSGANFWYITNRCGRTVTYTVIRPWWFDLKVTIAPNQTIEHRYPYHGIK